MRRYFFDTTDGEHFPDTEGELLVDDDAARAVAYRVASELMSNHAKAVWEGETFRVVARSEAGEVGRVVVSAARPDRA